MTPYTRLERAVLSALAAELRDVMPGLDRQIAASRPGRRRNTGFGLFTDLSVPAPAPASGPTGDFGTVHAMVAPLRDPIAFTARLQDGRLIGLMGDSYGQDTRALDFASAHFDQLFTLDGSGRSIPVQAAAHSEPAPEPRRPRQPAPVSIPAAPAQAAPPLGRVDDLKSLIRTARQGPDALRQAAQAAPRRALPADPASRIDQTTVLIGAWAVIAVAALLAVLIFGVPWVFAAVAAVWIGSAIRRPRALASLQAFVSGWDAARPGAAAWKALRDR